MRTQDIIDSIISTTKKLNEVSSLPNRQGIYVFYLNDSDDLGNFGTSGDALYVGLAEKSLNSRDSKTHLMTGKTGWSSLRRSLGAILRTPLNLHPQKRDINSNKLRADKYKFDEKGEERLTLWMVEHLKIGYWSTETPLAKKDLRKEEEAVILALKPTLDLDSRTKSLNPFAIELDGLRCICRDVVKGNPF